MTISHRAADAPASTAETLQSMKVARIACCCKLSDLLPLVQQLHRETVRGNAKKQERQSEAA
ncbi:hypothetical protein [Hymenobacter psychrotolerans]|uniref:Uncharacterized protein n=1 Tax=Hymenobacter psychrotolerans DSM 18569 TaxID=1121959 RepID=A0A1M7FV77_9BACT|nr:hypothetical protein [Hymenobacter psychrotolerans]SHM07984.1 hypothetical protein SAMN02746009_03905 [Hymenobacter psychrotolerans DSM 18569]